MEKCVIRDVPNVWSVLHKVTGAKCTIFNTTLVGASTKERALNVFNKYIADGEIMHKASIEGVKPLKIFTLEYQKPEIS